MTPKSSCERQGRQPSGQKAVAPLFSLDTLFFRAQSRIKGNTLQRASSAQSDVGPLFRQGALGEDSFYEVPAYMRKRIHKHDFDNRCRIAAYTDRVRSYMQGAA